jgi:anti-anti-sigma factor
MNISQEIRSDVAVLTVDGSQSSAPEVAPLHNHIKRLQTAGINKVVVDFTAVKWFGSCMLGVMTASLSTLRREGGDLLITGVASRITEILYATQLEQVFRSQDSVDQAIACFASRELRPVALSA